MIDLIILYFAIFIMVMFALKPIDWFLDNMHKRHMEERQAYMQERQAYYNYINQRCEDE